MIIIPKNWSEFQHYKDRAPPWIKLHRVLLDNYEFSCLPIASKALAPFLWLLASEYEGGRIDGSPEKISFRLRVTPDQFTEALKPLVSAGFFICDSAALAECEQQVRLETEGERETEVEAKIPAAPAAAMKSYVVNVAIADVVFETFWSTYPKRDGANPREPARKRFKAAVKSGADPDSIILSARRYADEMRQKGQFGTPYVAQAQTWLGQQRWFDYQPAAPTPEKAAQQAELAARHGYVWDNAAGKFVKKEKAA